MFEVTMVKFLAELIDVNPCLADSIFSNFEENFVFGHDNAH